MTDREQFEAWVKSRGGDCMKKGTPGEPMYLSSITREWLAAWQAARAAPAQPDQTLKEARRLAWVMAETKGEQWDAALKSLISLIMDGELTAAPSQPAANESDD